MEDPTGAIVGMFVVAILSTFLILIGGSMIIRFIMMKLYPGKYDGGGESCGGVSSIDSIWFD